MTRATSPNPRLAQLEAHADAADEARDAALAECVQLRKKVSSLEVDRDELQAGQETIKGKAANLQRRLTTLEAELAAAQEAHEARL